MMGTAGVACTSSTGDCFILGSFTSGFRDDALCEAGGGFCTVFGNKPADDCELAECQSAAASGLWLTGCPGPGGGDGVTGPRPPSQGSLFCSNGSARIIQASAGCTSFGVGFAAAGDGARTASPTARPIGNCDGLGGDGGGALAGTVVCGS